MKEEILKLRADVSALKTAEQSTIALIKGLKGTLDAGIESANAGDLTALRELSAELEASTDDLAKAVAENTPVAAPAEAGANKGEGTE